MSARHFPPPAPPHSPNATRLAPIPRDHQAATCILLVLVPRRGAMQQSGEGRGRAGGALSQRKFAPKLPHRPRAGGRRRAASAHSEGPRCRCLRSEAARRRGSWRAASKQGARRRRRPMPPPPGSRQAAPPAGRRTHTHASATDRPTDRRPQQPPAAPAARLLRLAAAPLLSLSFARRSCAPGGPGRHPRQPAALSTAQAPPAASQPASQRRGHGQRGAARPLKVRRGPRGCVHRHHAQPDAPVPEAARRGEARPRPGRRREVRVPLALPPPRAPRAAVVARRPPARRRPARRAARPARIRASPSAASCPRRPGRRRRTAPRQPTHPPARSPHRHPATITGRPRSFWTPPRRGPPARRRRPCGSPSPRRSAPRWRC